RQQHAFTITVIANAHQPVDEGTRSRSGRAHNKNWIAGQLIHRQTMAWRFDWQSPDLQRTRAHAPELNARGAFPAYRARSLTTGGSKRPGSVRPQSGLIFGFGFGFAFLLADSLLQRLELVRHALLFVTQNCHPRDDISLPPTKLRFLLVVRGLDVFHQ